MKTLILSILVITNFSLYSQVKKSVEPKHTGFYASGTLGIGSTNLKESAYLSGYGNVDMEISGLSYNMNLRIGYSVIENLQLYGMFGSNIMSNPTYKIKGTEVSTSSSTEVSLAHFGVGLSYYFMPVNIYAYFDVSSGENSIKADNKTSTTQKGAIFNLGLGKEWFISKHWGLGATMYFYTGSINDTPDDLGNTPSISNTGFGISFSATFN